MKTGLFRHDKKLGFVEVTQAEALTQMSKKSPRRLKKFAERVYKYHRLDVDCETDDNPIYSEAVAGCWVSAWLWVPK
jgi:hypothetical protein